MSLVLDKSTGRAWNQLESVLVISDESDYRRACKALVDLLDRIGGDEGHPQATLLDTLGTLVHVWELSHHHIPKAEPRKVLAFLMEEHGLSQQDLKEIGSQGIISELLSGKRELNVRQIRRLASRFGVSPAVFIAS